MSRLDGSVVLLVEDNTDINDMICRALDRAGAEALGTFGVADALDTLAARESLDLIVSDVQLRDGTGYTVIDAARERFPHLPVLVISGRPISPDELPANVTMLLKPFTMRELIAAAEASLDA